MHWTRSPIPFVRTLPGSTTPSTLRWERSMKTIPPIARRPYFAIANALRIRLGDVLIVPGGDGELVEAARQVRQEHAEMDALLAEFDRLPQPSRRARPDLDPDLEGFDRFEEEIAHALVRRTQIDAGREIAGARLAVSQAKLEEEGLRSARLPAHDLGVIADTLAAIWFGDTQRYVAALDL